jgi:hypothetical protein
MTRPLFFLLALAILGGIAHAGPLIWAGLFLAEGRPAGPQAPPHLTEQLQQVFGYPCYKVVRGVNIDLRAPHDHWVMAHSDFAMRIQTLPHPPGAPDGIAYEIYKDGFIIARGNYIIAPDTPLFINGPDFHRGRLIFVVEAR